MNNQAYDDTATRNPRKAYTDYENSTYTVVSKVAYLVGVQERIFENEYEPPKMEWYEKLTDRDIGLSFVLPLKEFRQGSWRIIARASAHNAS